MNPEEIKRLDQQIRHKARRIAAAIGWQTAYSNHGRVTAIRYPYALMFGRHRRMISICGTRHPEIDQGTAHDYQNIKVRLPLDTSAEVITDRIKQALIPRVKERTDRLIA
jgi:hypothetical protein